jgi:predicted outer membrane lipoprotein
MSITTRRTLGVALAVTLGVVIAIFEPHRHLLAAAWPLVNSFWFTYIAF